MIIILEVISLRESRSRDYILVFGGHYFGLKLFPWCMGAVAKSTCAFNASGLEPSCFARHTQRFLRFRFVFRRAHDPVFVLFLLLGQNFSVSDRKTILFRCRSKLTWIFISKCKWLRSTYQSSKFNINETVVLLLTCEKFGICSFRLLHSRGSPRVQYFRFHYRRLHKVCILIARAFPWFAVFCLNK